MFLLVQPPSLNAGVAQLVERILGKDEVTSSNLVIGSRKIEVFLSTLTDCE